MLPSYHWIFGITPGTGFCSTRISAKVLGQVHFRKDSIRHRLDMRIASEPFLAFQTGVSMVHLALIKSPVPLDTIG